ncbi:pentapeptide repeat-containing protein [Pontibacter mangrovi]|uniref:Pentapeptide repeat-containing protein n=1 Tax=Pontibacter mangrovi TaxID=2589816 RepID=A0A501WIW5_9BACT|nr:pentapeptide repeat-containing protein [Pontibacter mangrovi]TPE45536.1 pentapeptide repeat-containing protein [Pontibacter mangrovi]
MQAYTEGETFKGIDYTTQGFPKGEYENCVFDGCIFLNADLSGLVFIDCEFRNCDASMATLRDTAFREVQFAGCKLLGLHFEDCNKFLLSVRFQDCQLNLSSFYKTSLKGTTFSNCSLREADFAGADLTGATLSSCDLANATFDQTILEKADLRTAYNYQIDPESNRIRKAKFSLPEAVGLLHKYDISIS